MQTSCCHWKVFEGVDVGTSLEAAEQLRECSPICVCKAEQRVSSPHQSRQKRHSNGQVSSLVMETLGKMQVNGNGKGKVFPGSAWTRKGKKKKKRLKPPSVSKHTFLPVGGLVRNYSLQVLYSNAQHENADMVFFPSSTSTCLFQIQTRPYCNLMMLFPGRWITQSETLTSKFNKRQLIVYCTIPFQTEKQLPFAIVNDMTVDVVMEYCGLLLRFPLRGVTTLVTDLLLLITAVQVRLRLLATSFTHLQPQEGSSQ